MKRRAFLKQMGQAGVCLAVGVPAVVGLSNVATSGPPPDVLTKQMVKEMIDELAYQSLDAGTNVHFVHPANYAKLNLLTGEVGHYEGVKFIEQTHIL